MSFIFKVRQARPFRTRIQFPGLRQRPACCSQLEKDILSLDIQARVEVRPRSGSVILIHPDHPVDLDPVITLVRSRILHHPGGGDTTNGNKTALPGRSRPYHVSGRTLILSGLYLGFLMIRQVVAPVTPAATLMARLVSLPAALALWLALPIQRQALDKFRETGRPDMGMVSTGLLYFSLFTGNVATALGVAWLYNISGWTESRIRQHTRQLVKDMLTGRQTRAWKLIDGAQVEVDVSDLAPGDRIILGQGNRVPVDGTVLEGTALVNEAAMTGESLPVTKTCDQVVLAGTLVEEGQVRVRVEKTGDQTRMAAIVRLIETAQNDLGELGRTSVKISQYMVPVSLGLGSVVFLATGSLFTAVTFIMVTCPCALRLSTSAAVSVAMGNAAAQGILIKGGSHVEIAGKVDVLVLDKTGTLTDPVSRVTDIDVMDRRYKENTLLKMAAAALQPLSHPLSRAVTERAAKEELTLPRCLDRKLFVGQGVRADLGQGASTRTIFVGSRKFMEAKGIGFPQGQRAQIPMPETEHAQSAIFVALQTHILGCIHAAHMIREDASPETMERLRKAGVRHIAMLTGDTRAGTRDLVNTLDFDEVKWGMSPEDKAEWIRSRSASHPNDIIAVVGDGINDTPAFARSNLSFAVGESGEDLTLEYADIVLQKGGVGAVATTLELGKETLSVLRQSYGIAIGMNAVTLSLMGLGILSPLAGALIHNLITVTSVANAARLSMSH